MYKAYTFYVLMRLTAYDIQENKQAIPTKFINEITEKRVVEMVNHGILSR